MDGVTWVMADMGTAGAPDVRLFRALSDTVKEQQQRLGRMEKQFGLPNSAAPAALIEASRGLEALRRQAEVALA